MSNRRDDKKPVDPVDQKYSRGYQHRSPSEMLKIVSSLARSAVEAISSSIKDRGQPCTFVTIVGTQENSWRSLAFSEQLGLGEQGRPTRGAVAEAADLLKAAVPVISTIHDVAQPPARLMSDVNLNTLWLGCLAKELVQTKVTSVRLIQPAPETATGLPSLVDDKTTAKDRPRAAENLTLITELLAPTAALYRSWRPWRWHKAASYTGIAHWLLLCADQTICGAGQHQA